MSNSNMQEAAKRPRAAVYVDGFNLYYPIHFAQKNHLKWICLWKLSEIILRDHNVDIVKVVFCTAVPTEKDNRWVRHISYINALAASRVETLKGHHIIDENGERSEKQTDLNLGLSLITDAYENLFDVAVIISADSDQTATARFLKQKFLDKKLIVAAPWNKSVPTSIKTYAHSHFSISEDSLERAVMPAAVQGKTGLIHRPASYEPPNGWVHPNDRPTKKKT